MQLIELHGFFHVGSVPCHSRLLTILWPGRDPDWPIRYGRNGTRPGRA